MLKKIIKLHLNFYLTIHLYETNSNHLVLLAYSYSHQWTDDKQKRGTAFFGKIMELFKSL